MRRASLVWILAAALSGLTDQAREPGPPFEETAWASGLRFEHQNSPTSQKYMMEILAPGVALLDYDRDGWLDVFFTNGARLDDPMPPGQAPNKTDPRFWNRLYRNRRDGTFEDVTGKAGLRGAGYGMGAAVGDYDNDGDPDLYVTNYGRNLLYRNNGDGTFTDVTNASGTGDPRWSTSAAFLDYDWDGWLDLYVVNYLDYTFEKNPQCGDRRPGYRSYCGPTNFAASPDRLYRNNRDGTFSDASEAAGISNPEGKGLGIVTGDYDLDGHPDIYIANDSVMNFLYRGRPDSRFEEVALLAGAGYSGQGAAEAGMGTDMGDYNGDGRPDLVVTNLSFEGTALYRNEGGGAFLDVRLEAGLEDSLLMVGFGVGFLDFDNDGDLDLLTVNGHIVDNVHLYQDVLSFRQPKQLFENLGGRFYNLRKRAGPSVATPNLGRGAAFGDINNDGAIDIVVGNCGGRAELLVNRAGQSKNWLLVELEGTRSNRDAAGARIDARVGARTLHRQKHGGGSYLSAHDGRVHFGLGAATRVERLEIFWPSGRSQTLTDVKSNQVLRIKEPAL
jgi:hypothetical protein